jgi:hypothetical protein
VRDGRRQAAAAAMRARSADSAYGLATSGSAEAPCCIHPPTNHLTSLPLDLRGDSEPHDPPCSRKAAALRVACSRPCKLLTHVRYGIKSELNDSLNHSGGQTYSFVAAIARGASNRPRFGAAINWSQIAWR